MALVPASNGFIPTSELLTQACEMLTVARNPMDPRYAAASASLETLMVQGEFMVHLTYIFARLTPAHLPDDVRQLAGLVLKQGVVRAPLKALAPDVQAMVKVELLEALSDAHSTAVRRTAGTLVTTLASSSRAAGGIAAWPELLPWLFGLLDAAAHGASEGAMRGAAGALGCLAKLCEDGRMDSPTVDALVPRLVAFFGSPDAEARLHAVVAMQQLVGEPHPEGRLDAYLAALSGLSADADSRVRRAVCQSIVVLAERSPETLVPGLASVVEFMLHASKDATPEVAVAALDFWIPCCECPLLGEGSDKEEVLAAALPRLVPLLLGGMRFSSEEVADLEEDDDAHEPDRAEDLRPIFHKLGKGKGGGKGKGSAAAGGTAAGSEGGGEGGEEEVEEEEDGDEDDEVETYTVRKRCAATLDKVTERFGDRVLPLVLPELQARLGSADMWDREAAILALGALQTGAVGVEELLPTLFPYLLEHMAHPGCPQVREISCWTIGRYLTWAASTAWQGPDGETLAAPDSARLAPLTSALLARLSDGSKKVQQFACSTFAIYVEVCVQYELSAVLRPSGPLFDCLLAALARYHVKSSVIMFDTIGTLCDAVADELASDYHLAGKLLSPLLDLWSRTRDDDPVIYPLFECIASAAAAAKLNFQAYALPVLQRCCRLTEAVLMADASGELNPLTGEAYDKQLASSALDLIDGLVRGVEENMVRGWGVTTYT